jgi:hypothetical protein
MVKLKSKYDPEWTSWKSSGLGHDEVAENNAKQKLSPRNKAKPKTYSVMYLFNAQFSNLQSCCSSVGAEQFGTFCTGFVKFV